MLDDNTPNLTTNKTPTQKVNKQEKAQAAKKAAEQAASTGPQQVNVKYNPFAINQKSFEKGYADEVVITPRTRDEYVDLFRKAEARTAEATLHMCRVVYEAKQTLAEHDFADFCKSIGYRDESSVIRKFCSIGKVQPRLVTYAHHLPHEWSKIYSITQIPARMFEQYTGRNFDFRNLKGKELADLLHAAREHEPLETLIPRELDSRHFVFAKVLFTKPVVDAFDWQMVKRALAEVESRLPVRVKFEKEADAAYEWTKVKRYNANKTNSWATEFNPSKWDYGVDPIQPATHTDDKPEPSTA